MLAAASQSTLSSVQAEPAEREFGEKRALHRKILRKGVATKQELLKLAKDADGVGTAVHSKKMQRLADQVFGPSTKVLQSQGMGHLHSERVAADSRGIQIQVWSQQNSLASLSKGDGTEQMSLATTQAKIPFSVGVMSTSHAARKSTAHHVGRLDSKPKSPFHGRFRGESTQADLYTHLREDNMKQIGLSPKIWRWKPSKAEVATKAAPAY